MSHQKALPELAQDASCCEPTELDIGFHTLQLACVQNLPVDEVSFPLNFVSIDKTEWEILTREPLLTISCKSR